MSEIPESRSQPSKALAWTVLILLGLGAASLGLPRILRNSDSRTASERNILRELSRQRPGEGRLYFAAADSADEGVSEAQVGRAQLAALSMNSPSKQQTQSLIFLARGEPQKAAEILERLRSSEPDSPEILNDLGVAYIAMAANDPLTYFRALALFESAQRVAPNAAAPRFNRVLVYRNLGLSDLEAEATNEYRRLERNSNWLARAVPGDALSEAEAVSQLRKALEAKDMARADLLLRTTTELFRRAATEYALNPLDRDPNDPVMSFIAEQFELKYHDATFTAMLDPLRSRHRENVVQSRRLVRAGTEAYRTSRLPESLKLYSEAASVLRGVDSTFDRLWVDLNRADAENRVGNIAETRAILDNLIKVAREKNLRWLLGLGLASRGSGLPLADSHTDLLSTLRESEVVLEEIGAYEDSSRPLFYSAMSYYAAGNLDDSFRLAFRALRATRRDDHLRLTQLLWLAGSLSYRLGYSSYAIPFEERAVAEAKESGNLPILGTAMSYLASMYEANLQHDRAEKYMLLTREIADKIDVPIQKNQVSFNLNLVCGRIYLRRGNSAEARNCLQENLKFFENDARGQGPLRYFLAQSLLLLAQGYVLSNQFGEARSEFQRAIDVVEEDDTYLATEKFRLPFENERRLLYDSAIGFEYDHGDADDAWSYAQRYRSKLFLEFLGLTNPSLTAVHSEAIDRDKVQKLIPRDLQIVEYVMLDDRLLIWLISDSVFTSRSVPIARAALEEKIAGFVDGIREQKDVQKTSEEIYRLLISPVEEQLDPNRTVAIVPDQGLHRLPFGALSAAGNNFLVAKYALMESPSLTHLLATSSAASVKTSVVAFGARALDASTNRELSELETIYPGARSFNGDAADRSAFLTAMKSASIFHYAGHSQDASDPVTSSVLLDGALGGPNSVTAVDISVQKMLPNSLVVLASCDSSLGNSRDGLGMRGLTSAFLISGAGAVVGSLWRVETTSTSDLVIRFHDALAKTRMPVAQALRAAQLSFLQTFPEKSHPYYWSGFVVTGNASAVR